MIVKPPPTVPAIESASVAVPKAVPAPAKKPTKTSLKGVIMKKKSKSAPEVKAAPSDSSKAKQERDDSSPDPKRRKVAVAS